MPSYELNIMADFYPPCPVNARHGSLDLLETTWTRPDPARNVSLSKAGIARIDRGRSRLRLSEAVQMRLSCEVCSAEVVMVTEAQIEVLAPGAERTEPGRRTA